MRFSTLLQWRALTDVTTGSTTENLVRAEVNLCTVSVRKRVRKRRGVWVLTTQREWEISSMAALGGGKCAGMLRYGDMNN